MSTRPAARSSAGGREAGGAAGGGAVGATGGAPGRAVAGAADGAADDAAGAPPLVPAPGRPTPTDLPPYDRDAPLLTAAVSGGRPVAGVHACDEVVAVVGRGGDPRRELRLERLRGDGVPALRRPGGGCAVLLDRGNVLVSVAWPLPGIGHLGWAFAALSDWLAEGLRRAGLPGVTMRGVSDLVLGDRKVGGACIRRTRGLLHYATTLLVEPDLDLVERYLPHPPREPAYRAGRPHRAFMGRLAALEPRLDAPTLADRLATVLDTGELPASPPPPVAPPAP